MYTRHSSRWFACAYLGCRKLLLACPSTGRSDSLPANLATGYTRCVTTCRSARRDLEVSWAGGDKWVSVLQSLSGTSPVVARPVFAWFALWGLWSASIRMSLREDLRRCLNVVMNGYAQVEEIYEAYMTCFPTLAII